MRLLSGTMESDLKMNPLLFAQKGNADILNCHISFSGCVTILPLHYTYWFTLGATLSLISELKSEKATQASKNVFNKYK